MEYRNLHLHHHHQNQQQVQEQSSNFPIPHHHPDRINNTTTGNNWNPSINFLNNNGINNSSIVYPNGEIGYSRLWPSSTSSSSISPLITTQDLMIGYNNTCPTTTTSDHLQQQSSTNNNDHDHDGDDHETTLVKEEPTDSFSKLKINNNISTTPSSPYSDIEKSNYLFSTMFNNINKPINNYHHHHHHSHQDFYSFIQSQTNNSTFTDHDHDHDINSTSLLMLNNNNSSSHNNNNNGGFNSLLLQGNTTNNNLDLLISPTSCSSSSPSSSVHNSSNNNNNNLSLYSQTNSTTPLGHGHHHHHHDMQEYSRSNSSNMSTRSSSSLLNEVTIRSKRPSSFPETKEYSRAESKKSKSTSISRTTSNPPLKVRKEKLGDRIAALHRLVAPFGKTDTASVLTEAIGYIQFLHDQVQTLSMPYMKSVQQTKPPRKIQQVHGLGNEEETELMKKVDLRSRGLCLVPLSCASYLNGFD
ncbi:hypothetical protein CsatB_024640 [Cannabis sativa]